MPIPTLPSFFPFSFRFFLPSLYPAPPAKAVADCPASLPFTPVSKISSFAAHALTNHHCQAPTSPSASSTSSSSADSLSPDALTVPVRAHLRHTRSVDHIYAAKQPPPSGCNPRAMPYALPMPSPTVVLSVPLVARDTVITPTFSFPSRTSPPIAGSTSKATRESHVPVVLVENNKENNGPSRALGPMPLIPRTSSASRLRSMAPGTLSNVRAPTLSVVASSPEASTSALPAVPSQPYASSAARATTSPPRRTSPPRNSPPRTSPPRTSPPRNSPPRNLPAHARHARRMPLAVQVSRDLNASPQQPSPPPSSPVSTKAPVNLRLNFDALKRTLSEAQMASPHGHRGHAHSQSVSNTSDFLTPTLPGTRSEMMVRKKSGEVVKSALRTPNAQRQFCKSEPTTPTSAPKYVHFNSQLEHVKLFLAEQKPLAVSRDGSPTETSEGELSSANEYPFPLAYASSDDEKIRRALAIRVLNLPPLHAQDMEADVRLETLTLSDDARALNGSLVVRNLAFNKWVAVRFTLDRWQTTSEVSARHVESIRGGAFDRFSFSVRLTDLLPRIEAKTMILAVRYNVEGREMWDNNRGEDYRVEFSKKGAEKRKEWPVKAAALDQMADLRRELEKVVADEMSPPSVVGKASAVLSRRGDKSLSLLAPPVLRNPDDASFSDSPLAQRYNLSASLKSNNWPARPSPTPQSSVPFPSTRVAQIPSPNTIPFPSGGDLPRMDPRGSPRDAPRPTFDVPPRSPSPEGLPSPRRHHQRSYFDQWQGIGTSAVRKTPPGTPGSGTLTPGDSVLGSGRFNSFPPVSPSPSLETIARTIKPMPSPLPLPPVAAAQAAVAVPWATGMPLPPSPEDDDSTASLSTGSSISQSPTSPAAQVTPNIMPSLALVEESGEVGPHSYSYFLDRFCFYTGGDGVGVAGPPAADVSPRRTLSASSLGTYGSPTLDNYMGSFSGGVSFTPPKGTPRSLTPPAVVLTPEIDLASHVSEPVAG